MQPKQLGPYRILRRLGRGGMGTVHEGLNVETDEAAAVKILSDALAEEAGFRERFAAEIETLRKLNHPNIVRLFGFGEQDGLLYYAMELVDGLSLERELREGRRFGWREVTEIGIGIARALQHAHNRGIIHRDIKPGNLLEATDGTVKLSDFGIARLFGRHRLTDAGNVLGTIEYMAPEQANGKVPGPAGDLYSLGGVLYALLTGRAPFQASSLAEMVDKHRSTRPPSVTRYAGDVPFHLAQIVALLLEKSPEDRITTAQVLARRLEDLLEDLSVTEGEVGDADGDADADRVEGVLDEDGFRLASPGELDALPSTRELDRLELGSLTPSRPVPPVAESQELAVEQSKSSHSDDSGSSIASAPSSHHDPSRDVRNPGLAVGSRDSDESSTDGEPATDRPKGTIVASRGGHFTTVQREEADEFEVESDVRGTQISPQTWFLALALVAVGGFVWYLLQPPSADGLYADIQEITADESIASLRSAEDEIEEFILRFPNDDRGALLREYVRRIEMDRLEKKMELRRKGLLTSISLLPIERDYLEAIRYAEIDEERGMAKLAALVELYRFETDPSEPTRQYLALATRRLDRFGRRMIEMTPARLLGLQDRLDHADELEQESPEDAQRIRRAVIVLYEHKPWAAPAVERARNPHTNPQRKQEPKH